METDFAPVLNEEIEFNIAVFCDIAKSNGVALSVQDLMLLISLDMSEEQLSHAWKKSSFLSSRYGISSGVIIEKSSKVSSPEDHVLETEKREISERFLRATSNASYAKQFGSFIGSGLFKVLSISGSTSYYSVSKDDDLDFFCITPKGRMWISFVKALVLARAFRFSVQNSPWLCLSYVADESFVNAEFMANQDGLFARDAISAQVVMGETYYRTLLRDNSWMAEYFPKLYTLRVRNSKRESVIAGPDSARTRIANLFFYYTAGTYIKVKSHLLNRKFMKARKTASLFQLRIGPDHCIYESVEYVRLRNLYSRLKKSEVTAARLVSQ